MLFVSLVLVAGGIAAGWLMYRNIAVQDRHNTAPVDPFEQRQPGLFRFLERKMWLDELYEESFVLWSTTLARLSDWLDRYFWDGLVRGFGGLGQLLGIFTANFDQHGINSGVDGATARARGLGGLISARHSGQIQTYLGAIAVGMLALLLLYAWLG
jgi:NADH:ubiquinone oxidoreductase subunit 5 (subunit L)/multisubunit Na+/H+ antiporter MnhA subunit